MCFCRARVIVICTRDYLKLYANMPIKPLGIERYVFGFNIVFNNFSVISRLDGIWLRQGVHCHVGDFKMFDGVQKVIVLSHCDIKSQAHNTDAVANRANPTLKIRVPSGEQLKLLFTTLAYI